MKINCELDNELIDDDYYCYYQCESSMGNGEITASGMN